MNLLLDTCTFLWLIGQPEKVSSDAAKVIADPVNPLFLSAASSWEIAVKWSIGTLDLTEAPSTLIPENREALGIQSLPLDEAAALKVEPFPLHHRDPFDRMLLARRPSTA